MRLSRAGSYIHCSVAFLESDVEGIEERVLSASETEPLLLNRGDSSSDNSGGGGDDEVCEALGRNRPVSSIESGWGPSEEPAEVMPCLDPPLSSPKFSSGVKGGEGDPISVAGPGSERLGLGVLWI